MARDKRWNFVPFLIIRAVQLLFAVIILGTSAYIVSRSFPVVWWGALSLFTSLLAVLWIIAAFVLYFMGLLLPLAVVIIDVFIFVFLLVSMAGTGSSGYVGSSCVVYLIDDFSFETTISTPCLVVKANFALELLSMFLFIATLISASTALHKTRKDLSGKKYNAGQPFISGASTDAATQMEGGTAMVEQGQYYNPNQPQQGSVLPVYTQQPQPHPYPLQPLPYSPQPLPYSPPPQQESIYQPPPQPQQPQPVYQQGPTYEGFISPPTSTSPAPLPQQQQQVATHSTGPPSELAPMRPPVPSGGVVRGNELSS